MRKACLVASSWRRSAGAHVGQVLRCVHSPQKASVSGCDAQNAAVRVVNGGAFGRLVYAVPPAHQAGARVAQRGRVGEAAQRAREP